jgi:putative transcriptional regulator
VIALNATCVDIKAIIVPATLSQEILMDAVFNPPDVSRVTWKLREVLARRKVTNKALAEKMGVHPTNISRLKSRDTLPAIGNEEIERFRVAITELSQESFGVCTLSELIGLEEDED